MIGVQNPLSSILIGSLGARAVTSAILVLAAIICIARTALAHPDQQEESRVDAALAGLASQDLDTRERALSALLAQSEIEVGSPTPIRVRMNNLLRSHPQRAERIKTTLIAALETQDAD